jgi:alpha-beta hydrolase superfamily lysophospholipase
MDKACERAPEMSLPLYMQIAGADELVDPAAARRFFEKAGSADKNLTVYDGYYHEIYNEPPEQRIRPLNDLANWIKARAV